MAAKWENQKGDVVDLAPIKREMNTYKGRDVRTSLAIISFDWQGGKGEFLDLPAQFTTE